MDIKKNDQKKVVYLRTIDTLPWIERYRPVDLDDLVAQDFIVTTLRALIKQNKLPHLLFYGPPGTGKTSTILCIAREMFGDKFNSMVLELNASDSRGIDTVRNDIQEFAGTTKLFSNGSKLVILDECDNMTKDAQMALRRVIEKYSRHTRFCLISNYANKIIPALQSRCTRFRFGPLKNSLVVSRVKEIAQKENVELTEGGLNSALKLGKGDMRKILNIIQSTALAHKGKVDEVSIYRCTGMPTEIDIVHCREALMNKNIKESFNIIQKIQLDHGVSLIDILTSLNEYLYAVKLPMNVRCKVLIDMANIEYSLSTGALESLQLGSLVGSFYQIRILLSKQLKIET